MYKNGDPTMLPRSQRLLLPFYSVGGSNVVLGSALGRDTSQLPAPLDT